MTFMTSLQLSLHTLFWKDYSSSMFVRLVVWWGCLPRKVSKYEQSIGHVCAMVRCAKNQSEASSLSRVSAWLCCRWAVKSRSENSQVCLRGAGLFEESKWEQSGVVSACMVLSLGFVKSRNEINRACMRPWCCHWAAWRVEIRSQACWWLRCVKSRNGRNNQAAMSLSGVTWEVYCDCAFVCGGACYTWKECRKKVS